MIEGTKEKGGINMNKGKPSVRMRAKKDTCIVFDKET